MRRFEQTYMVLAGGDCPIDLVFGQARRNMPRTVPAKCFETNRNGALQIATIAVHWQVLAQFRTGIESPGIGVRKYLWPLPVGIVQRGQENLGRSCRGCQKKILAISVKIGE